MEAKPKNRYNVSDEIRIKFKPILEAYLHRMESLTTEQVENMGNEELGLDFTDMGITPWQLKGILEELGYKDTSYDTNGWQLDFWVNMERTDGKTFPSMCEKLVINGTGVTFELRLYIDGFDF